MIRRLVARVLREAGWILDDLADHVHPLDRHQIDPPPGVSPGWAEHFDAVMSAEPCPFCGETDCVGNACLETSSEQFIWGCGEGHVE